MAVGIDIDAILKGLAFVADHTHEAADIFESELCMPNIKMPTMVAPDKKTLKKSVKSMFFMVQTRCEVETIKY